MEVFERFFFEKGANIRMDMDGLLKIATLDISKFERLKFWLSARSLSMRLSVAKKRVKRGGEMSRVRIYDLAKELKPETKKNLKIAGRMGIAGALSVAGPRRKPPTKKPKKGGAK